MKIASRAGERKIDRFGGTSMTAWNYMLEVKSGTLQRLMHTAVLATSACPVAYDFPEILCHRLLAMAFVQADAGLQHALMTNAR